MIVLILIATLVVGFMGLVIWALCKAASGV